MLSPQQAEDVAKSFYKAMKGFGTDEPRIIKEMTTFNKQQRQIIKGIYFNMFGHTLEEDLKKDISGHFLKCCLGLLLTTEEFEAKCINKAIGRIGTNCNVIIQILCSKEAHEVQALRYAYQRLYSRALDKDLEKVEGGALGRIFRSIALGVRAPDGPLNIDLARTEAKELYDAGQGKLGTDEIEFVRILCSRSFPQLKITFEEYYRYANCDIETAIKKEMIGDLQRACIAIVKCSINKPSYFSELLHDTVKGLGTKDDDLVRILVSRSEIDLPLIKKQYLDTYGKSLFDAVKSDTSGDYQKILLTLIGKD